ncbi:MAG: rRNA maturation RNase YbeY [Alphaproteobacteria bacterium]|nr:rRNA maturation RNase YbeY [Alphaproteobacteria bacterium]
MNTEIIFEDNSWMECCRDDINTAAEAVFAQLNLKHDDVEICFLCTNDESVRILNKTYRGVDRPTNVLSFPADSYDDEDSSCTCEANTSCDCKICNCKDDKPPCLLGSVAFAFETIRDESMNQNKSFDDHLKHLVVHSVLHLLGYDHIDDEDAKKMEELETKILSNMGVNDPYDSEML